MEVTLLFEDEHLFIAYKPSGLHSVRGKGASLADLLAERYPHLTGIGGSSADVGLVQRLDQETSGVLLGAHSQEVWVALHEQLERGSIGKSYVAIVEGSFPEEIEFFSYLGSPYRGGSKVRVYHEIPDKPHRALPGTSVFRPLALHPAGHCSLVSIVASPARRHQVRAHAAHLGHPLVGDTLYGATSELGGLSKTSRSFFLHADNITLTHPRTGETITATAPLDREIEWPK